MDLSPTLVDQKFYVQLDIATAIVLDFVRFDAQIKISWMKYPNIIIDLIWLSN